MVACVAQSAVCLLEFEDRPDLAKQLKALDGCSYPPSLQKQAGLIRMLQQQLDEYFSTKRKKFTLPILLNGTPFQQKIWKKLQEIPYGVTTTYRDLAADAGDPMAVRAVAAANGANRLAILIPCHRVIGSDGKLTGYAGGLWRKDWLLNHERGIQTIRFED